MKRTTLPVNIFSCKKLNSFFYTNFLPFWKDNIRCGNNELSAVLVFRNCIVGTRWHNLTSGLREISRRNSCFLSSTNSFSAFRSENFRNVMQSRQKGEEETEHTCGEKKNICSKYSSPASIILILTRQLKAQHLTQICINERVQFLR